MEVIKRRTHNKGIPTPTFESDAHAFFTTFRNMNYGLEASDFLKLLGDQGELVESIPKEEKYTKKGIPKAKRYIKNSIPKPLGKTAQLIIDMMVQDPTYTTEDFASAAHVTIPAIKKQLKNLTEKGIVTRVGANRGGFWKVQNPNKNE